MSYLNMHSSGNQAGEQTSIPLHSTPSILDIEGTEVVHSDVGKRRMRRFHSFSWQVSHELLHRKAVIFLALHTSFQDIADLLVSTQQEKLSSEMRERVVCSDVAVSLMYISDDESGDVMFGKDDWMLVRICRVFESASDTQQTVF